MRTKHLLVLIPAFLAFSGCSDDTGSSNGGNGGKDSGAKIYWIGSDYATGELRAAAP